MPLCHLGSKVLESANVIIRPFTVQDAPAMYAYASDPETTKIMRFSTHKSIEETEALLKQWEHAYSSERFYNWAVVCKECNEVIGSIGLVEVNDFHCQADCGYCYRKDHWGRGIATECLRRVIQFCFEEMGTNRLEALHSIENPASGCVMRKAGMRREGVKREYFPTDHGYVDCVMYAITASDYAESVSKGS